MNRSHRVEQNIGIIACSVPALQPLFKKYFDTRATKNTSKPGTKNNAGLSSWKDSTANAFSRTSQRSRTFHSIKNDASSDSEERILPGDKAKDGITKTTDVELFYSDAGKTGPPNSGPNYSIEMV